MKKLRWQLLIIFLTGLVVGVLLLGEQRTGGGTSSAPEPVQGGTYTEALVGSLQRLNPLLDYYNPVDRDVNRLLFSSLVRFDSRGIPMPDLAESWGISQDGTIYNFALRPNLKWHDGRPLTSDDVAFTIDLFRQDGSPLPEDLQTFWKDIEVKSLDETNLQFRLPEPFAPFLDYLAFAVLPRHLLGDIPAAEMVNAPFGLQPVGSGPYRFDHLIVENDVISGVVLSAYEEYHFKRPYIDQITFRYYPDGSSALQAYREGAVQGIGQVPADILQPVLAEPNLAVYTGRKPELSLVLFNLKNPEVSFLADVNVRKALMMGLNRRWLVNHLLNGQAILAEGPIFPGTWAYYDGTQPYAFDVDKATLTLKEAGYVLSGETDTVRKKADVALSFILLHPDDDTHRLMAEAIQKDWAKLGVQVQLEAVPYDLLINERLAGREYQAALVDLNLTRSPDPDPYPFWDQVQATGGQNYTQWDQRMASEYLEQARVALDLNERARLYRNFQVLFHDELPALPLYYPVYAYAVDKQVQGVRMGPLFDSSDRFASVREWFLIARAAATAVP